MQGESSTKKPSKQVTNRGVIAVKKLVDWKIWCRVRKELECWKIEGLRIGNVPAVAYSLTDET